MNLVSSPSEGGNTPLTYKTYEEILREEKILQKNNWQIDVGNKEIYLRFEDDYAYIEFNSNEDAIQFMQEWKIKIINSSRGLSARIKKESAELEDLIKTKKALIEAGIYAVDRTCMCHCHNEGNHVMHIMACCDLCGEKYINEDGSINEEKLEELMKKV